MRILVVGAGIGGLAAARALLADGHEVAVLERADGPRDGGAAVTLWSNGTGILGELGVSLDGVGARIDALVSHDHHGRRLNTVDVSHAAAHYGHPNVSLPRRRLLERLLDGLPSGVVRYGRAVTGHTQDAGGVRVDCVDGSTETGDLLVAADGRGSVIRDALWGGDPARYARYATWQGVTAIATAVTVGTAGAMFVGPAGLCGLNPAGEGLLQWWFDARWASGTPAPDSPVAMLRERFGPWEAAPVREVLAAITDADVGFFPHLRHRVPRTWGTGRATLVGDAAHSMPPTRAQGANQALEDAWALAVALRGGGDDLAATLRAYERARAPRAGLVARQSAREDINDYRAALLTRYLPDGPIARYYTRWLGRISNYLG
jgi:FAD-dependent urate hydroxylase